MTERGLRRLPAEADGLWEINATWWAEGFTDGADPEYTEQILPLAAEHLAGARHILDVGCGEGQISRLAAGLPSAIRVVGVDPTAAQLALAVERAPAAPAAAAAPAARTAPAPAAPATQGAATQGPAYARADAARLPFPDGSFDAAIACLVFEHVTDVDAALSEIGRVLQPGGRFVFMLNHPLLQAPGSGWIDDTILEEQYWRIGPYLVEDHAVEEVAKNVWIPFIHRPLSRYVNALADAGMVITRMEEPAPPPGFLRLAKEYAQAATIPRLLLLRAERRAPISGV